MTQALRSPFTSKLGHPSSSLVPPPASYASRFDIGSSVRPSINESIRRGLSEDENSATPVNTNSAYGSFYTSTEPYATSEGFSPISPFSERSDYANQFAAQTTNTRSPTSFPCSTNLTNYSTISAREKHNDPISRARAASLATSLRTSMSYPQLSMEYGDNLANTSATPALSTQREHPNGYSLDSMVASHSTGYPRKYLANHKVHISKSIKLALKDSILLCQPTPNLSPHLSPQEPAKGRSTDSYSHQQALDSCIMAKGCKVRL